MWRIWILLVAACGNGNLSPAHIDCGGFPCAAGLLCCFDANAAATCAATCPAHTVTVLCDDAGDCPGSHCCMQYHYEDTPNTARNCYETGTVSCAAECVRSQPPLTSCSGNAVERLCSVSPDCAGNDTAINCCRSPYWSYCVDDQTKAAIVQRGGTCS